MEYSNLNHFFSKEVAALKQIGNLPKAFQILALTGVFPFIILSALLSIAFNVCIFFYELASSGATYLELWIKDTKENSGWFAEGIIYLSTLPFVFLLRALLSLFTAVFFIYWFFMQCAYYVATLGGIKWRPYITRVDTNDTIENYKTVTPKKTACIASVIIFAVFVLTILISAILFFANHYTFFEVCPWIIIFYLIFTVSFVVRIFKKAPCSDGEEEAQNEDTYDEYDDFELPEV